MVDEAMPGAHRPEAGARSPPPGSATRSTWSWGPWAALGGYGAYVCGSRRDRLPSHRPPFIFSTALPHPWSRPPRRRWNSPAPPPRQAAARTPPPSRGLERGPGRGRRETRSCP
jgi:hypothetical protein